MDDTVSRSSVDSLSMGDEYVVVNAEPRLKIADNGDISDLEKKLSEVLCDDNNSSSAQHANNGQQSAKTGSMGDRSNMVEIKVDGDNKNLAGVGETGKDHVVNKHVLGGMPGPEEDDKKANAKSPSSEEDSGES